MRLIVHDVNSVEIEDPTQEKQGTLATWERPGIPGEGQSSGRSPLEQAVCMTIGTIHLQWFMHLLTFL